MTQSIPLPTQAELQSLFDYSVITGELRWRRTYNNVYNGRVAGTVLTNGYRYVTLNEKRRLTHRIIWKLVTGTEPRVIDHADLDRTNNAWHNLREGTQADNKANAGQHRDSTSPYKGVYLHGCRWISKLMRDGKRHHLGVFDTPEQARDAYNAASARLSGEFHRAA